jgi:hypothetical protein
MICQHHRMDREGVSFNRAINDSVRAGAAAPRDFTTTPVSLGRPRVSLDKASQLAAQLEDEAIVDTMRAGR